MSRAKWLRAAIATAVAAATPASAAEGPVALRWITAAPVADQAAGELGAGPGCSRRRPASPNEMRQAIESGVLDSRLRDDLKAAGFSVVGGMARTSHGVAPVSVAAEVRVTSFLGCLNGWGSDFDTVSGKVSMVVDWVVRDRATGAELARLTTREGVDRKKDTGGLLYLTQDAFSANSKAFLASPAVQAALRRPPFDLPRPDDGPARDPLKVVSPPWRPTAFGSRTLLDVPKIVESGFDPTDQDAASARETYKFRATAGETVSVVVSDAQRPLTLSLRDMSGALISESFRDNPTVEFKAPVTGDYLITVAAVDEPRQTQYRLKIDSDLRPLPRRKSEAADMPMRPPGPNAAPAPPASRPFPKLTPAPGVLAAEIGKPIVRPSGETGASLDVFAFIGEAGASLHATAGDAAPDGYRITLFTPEGAEMMEADGKGQAKLDAVLPKDGIYLVAVSRQDGAKPYVLKLTAETPDLFQWSFRKLAGYEVLGANGQVRYSTCWTAPGSTLRYDFPDGARRFLSVQPGGAGRWEAPGKDTRPFTTEFSDGAFKRTYANDPAPPETWSLDEAEPTSGRYRGYRCR